MADQNNTPSFFDRLTSMNVTATAIAIAAIVGVIWFLLSDGQTLRDADRARGLLTFSVAIVTVAIALLLVLFIVTSGQPTEELKNKFGFGKDILMVFVGILGTIMGFYYGTDKISTKDIPGIGNQQSASNQLETKAFELLLKQNYEDAVKAFDLATGSTPISPNINNLQYVSKYLQEHATELKGDAQTSAKSWKELYCGISNNNRAVGLSKELNDKFESACKAPAASPPPTNRNSGANANVSTEANRNSDVGPASNSNR